MFSMHCMCMLDRKYIYVKPSNLYWNWFQMRWCKKHKNCKAHSNEQKNCITFKSPTLFDQFAGKGVDGDRYSAIKILFYAAFIGGDIFFRDRLFGLYKVYTSYMNGSRKVYLYNNERCNCSFILFGGWTFYEIANSGQICLNHVSLLDRNFSFGNHLCPNFLNHLLLLYP